MRKLCSITAAAILATSAFGADLVQENSGGFIGVGLGSHSITGSSASTTTTSGTSQTIFQNKTGFNAEIIGGYKAFLNDWFGYRAYLSIGLNNNDQTTKNQATTTGNRFGLALSANSDLLFNFIGNKTVHFGAYAGLGYGFDLGFYSARNSTTIVGAHLLALNAGTRVQIAQRHGIELGIKYAPFIALHTTTTTTNENIGAITYNLKYIYTF